MVKFYSILLLLLMGCNAKHSHQNGKKSAKYKSEVMNAQDRLSFQDMMVLTKKQAIEKYGSPSAQQKFILDDTQGEFRNGISDLFTEKERQSESVVIDEVTWEKDEDTWITVWYQVLENSATPKNMYIWKKGMEF